MFRICSELFLINKSGINYFFIFLLRHGQANFRYTVDGGTRKFVPVPRCSAFVLECSVFVLNCSTLFDLLCSIRMHIILQDFDMLLGILR